MIARVMAMILVMAAPLSAQQVRDVSLIARDSVSATLAWTEPVDGATYEVRYMEPPLRWHEATRAEDGSCAYPVDGVAAGRRISCTIEGLTPGVRYNFQIRSTWPVEASNRIRLIVQ